MASPELHLTEHFPVSVTELYHAFTDTNALGAWWRPMEDDLAGIVMELHPGGNLHYTFNKQAFEVTGQYQEVEPDTRLVFSWNWTFVSDDTADEHFTLQLNFGNAAEGSVLDIVQEGFKHSDERQAHEEGWKIGLHQLREYLASPAGKSPPADRRPAIG